jgi:hypothetical protein
LTTLLERVATLSPHDVSFVDKIEFGGCGATAAHKNSLISVTSTEMRRVCCDEPPNKNGAG